MAETRIDELRRRLEREPGSRLFAQLAEELRKAGELVEAIRVARAGLTLHSSYPSARLTLGRALLDSGDAGGARVELETALREAPDNILASRFLAQAREALGDLRGAQEQYQRTLQMAPGDSQLQAQLTAVETRLRGPAGPPPASAAGRPTAAAQPADTASGLAPTVRLPASQPTPGAPPPAPVAAPPPVAARAAVSPPPGLQAPELPQSPRGDFELAGTAPPGTVQHTWFAPSEVAATAALPATLVDAARSGLQSEPGVRSAPPPPPAIPAPPAPAAAPAPPARAAAPTPPPPPVAVARDAPATPPAATESATPFSSSTLAELYYQQGLVERAVDVYRQLVQQDPGNEKARVRLVELETADAPDDRAARRRALERTIAGLESLLAVVQRR